jgi:hypothetical protein
MYPPPPPPGLSLCYLSTMIHRHHHDNPQVLVRTNPSVVVALLIFFTQAIEAYSYFISILFPPFLGALQSHFAHDVFL